MNHFVHALIRNSQVDSNQLIFMNRKRQYLNFSYKELWKSVEKYAGYLQSVGVKQGDVVSLVLPTGVEFISAFFACQLIRAIPVALYPPTAMSQINDWLSRTSTMIDSVGSKFLITDIKLSSLTDSLIEFCPNLNTQIVEEINQSSFDADYNLAELSENDICFLQFSSGTTGRPKAVQITQKNAIANAKMMFEGTSENKVDSNEIKIVTWLPLYHDMGLVGMFLCPLLQNKSIVLIRPDDFIRKPVLWLQAIHDHKCTITAAPNFAFGLLVKRVSPQVIKELDLSSMKQALCGAEMIYKETIDKCIEHLSPAGFNPNSIVAGYGMAEATLGVTLSSNQEPLKFITVCEELLRKGKVVLSDVGVSICSVGKTLNTAKIQILDENLSEVSENVVGRLMIAGPSLSPGYYNDKSKTEATFTDGWLDSGDEGFFHNGEIYICGRVKDTIIIRGKNYYPTMIEEKIFQLEGLRKGRVVVSSDYVSNSGSEEVIVLAELSHNKISVEKQLEIQRQIKEIVLSEGLPVLTVELLATGSLPKTSSGKLKRRQAISLWKEKSLNEEINNETLDKYVTLMKLTKDVLLKNLIFQSKKYVRKINKYS